MPGEPRLSPWARGAVLCMAALAALTAGDLVWRLGLPSAWDELHGFTLLQLGREGSVLPFAWGRGGAFRRLFSLLYGQGALAAQGGMLALLGLEAWLCWRLARRLGGEAAAFGAVAALALSRFTLLRSHTLMGFSLVPLYVLLAWSLAEEVQHRALALAAGFASAILLCDYEAGLAALPGLSLLAWQRARQGRARAMGAWALGLGLGLGAMAWLSRGQWQHWALLRGPARWDAPGPWWRAGALNLSTFFFGRPGIEASLGPSAAFAPWALALACLGLPRLGWPLAALLLGGLLPLFLPARPFVEAQRALVAWPVLCAAAGLGLGRLVGHLPRWRPSRAALAFGLLAALGLAQSARAFYAWRSAYETDSYEHSFRLLRTARTLDKLRAREGGWLLSDLNHRSMAYFRSLPRSHDAPGPTWVLLSGEQVGPRPPKAWGRWYEVRHPGGLFSTWILRVAPGQEGLWQRRQAALAPAAPLYVLQGPSQAMASVELGALQRERDPFIRSVLIDRALTMATELRAWPSDLLAWVAAQPDLTPRQALAAAQALRASDPQRALGLVERALAQDPQRLGARIFRRELLAQLGR